MKVYLKERGLLLSRRRENEDAPESRIKRNVDANLHLLRTHTHNTEDGRNTSSACTCQTWSLQPLLPCCDLLSHCVCGAVVEDGGASLIPRR